MARLLNGIKATSAEWISALVQMDAVAGPVSQIGFVQGIEG